MDASASASPAATARRRERLTWRVWRLAARPRDGACNPAGVDRELAEHPADRVRVAREVEAGRAGRRLRAGDDRLAALVQHAELSYQRLESAPPAGRDGHEPRG